MVNFFLSEIKPLSLHQPWLLVWIQLLGAAFCQSLFLNFYSLNRSLQTWLWAFIIMSFDQQNRLSSVNATLIEVLEMMPSSWWLLSKPFVTVGCSPCGGCGVLESSCGSVWARMVDLCLYSIPLLVSLWSTGSWLEPTCRRWCSVVAQFTKLNRWPILWLWPEVLVPATQPSWCPYGCVGWSLAPLVLSSLPVTWFARSLMLLWLLTVDCVPCVELERLHQ